MIYYMKKNNRSFISYLAVSFIILQLVSQITPQNHSSQHINISKLVMASNFNSSNINLSSTINEDNIIQQGSYTEINSDNNINYYGLRKCNSTLNEFYSKSSVSENAKLLTEHLPDSFQYKVVNEDALKAYLETRSSLLMKEPYFTSIINVARDFNINPVLLFAITGQEQGFVPTNQDGAAQIANNPYNVFCSWQDYNTDIIDSSQIACRTIISLSKGKPDNVDTLVWINRKYSADQNWNNGVRTLYNDINTFIDNYNK